MNQIEQLNHDGKAIAFIVKSKFRPPRTTFVTPDDFTQQVGFITYSTGQTIERHVHVPLKRELVGTSEVVVVLEGTCEIDIYTDDRQLIATRVLEVGDLVVMATGGHGFRMLKDTVLLEVKQGPYTGLTEKEHF